jgi:hypothetical protein
VSDHGSIREILELAAAEPGGLERLAAGDTPESAATAAHLAGCPDCLQEMERLGAAVALLRPIVAATPDPVVRERTLAAVRELGIARGAPAAPDMGSAPGATPDARGGRGRRALVLATLAAGLVVGLVGGLLVAGGGPPAGSADTAAALRAITAETATVAAAGDAEEVALRDTEGRPAGTLVLSPSTRRGVVSATGLQEPADGAEYRCWVEVEGERLVLGTMWHAGPVAWWAGELALPTAIPADVRYGVSRVEPGSTEPGAVVLVGDR